MSAGEQEAQAEAGAEESGSILDSMLSAMPKVVERDEGSDMVKNLIGVAMSGTMSWDKSCTKTLSSAIGALDEKLSEQLAAVMQHEQFQKLEGSWRGLHHLVMNTETSKQLKLRMLNGAHSMLAYTGFLAGHPYVRDVMADPALTRLVGRHLDAAAQTLEPLPAIDFATYAAELKDRFKNPAIAHETYQIAMDGTQKLPQRIFAPALHALAHGQYLRPFAFATAMWMRYALGQTEAGAAYDLRDPRAAEIATALNGLPRDGGRISAALHERLTLIPDALAQNDNWRATVAKILSHILTDGVAATIKAEAKL